MLSCQISCHCILPARKTHIYRGLTRMVSCQISCHFILHLRPIRRNIDLSVSFSFVASPVEYLTEVWCDVYFSHFVSSSLSTKLKWCSPQISCKDTYPWSTQQTRQPAKQAHKNNMGARKNGAREGNTCLPRALRSLLHPNYFHANKENFIHRSLAKQCSVERFGITSQLHYIGVGFISELFSSSKKWLGVPLSPSPAGWDASPLHLRLSYSIPWHSLRW